MRYRFRAKTGQSKNGRSLVFSANSLAVRLLTTLVLLFAHSLAIAGSFHLTLTDAITQDTINNQRVDAYLIDASGDRSWKAKATTDGAGKVAFELDNLTPGTTYKFSTKVFSDYRSELSVTQSSADKKWQIGSFIAKIVNGTVASLPPLSDTRVSIQRLADNGEFKWFAAALTDENGYIRVDLPGLGSGSTYRLYAKSPINGQSKFSHTLKHTKPYTFIVGNLPLSVWLTDNETGQALSDTEITVYELLHNGSSKWTTKAKTDASGAVVFDLDGLGKGRNYYLRTKVFNNFWAKSALILAPQDYHWQLGSWLVHVFNGNQSPASPLPNHEIFIEHLKENGEFGWFAKTTTDTQGKLKLDLPATANGQVYRLKAKSLIDGSYKYGPEIKQPDIYHFTVGNLPLQITLTDAATGEALTGLDVTVYERLADDSKKWVTRRTTDDNGSLMLDLDGLDSGRKYIIETKAFNNFRYYSSPFTAPGQYTLQLGTIQVQVLNGSIEPLPPLTEAEITISKRNRDGQYKWFAQAHTDAAGMLKIDLPGVGSGAQYRLSAASPVSGKTKYSAPITSLGHHQFIVGNPAVNVSLINAISGQTIPAIDVMVYRINADGSPSWVTKRRTDDNGQVVFDLDNIATGTRYFLKAKPFNGGYTFSDPIVQYGNFDFRVGAVPVTLVNSEDTSPFPQKKVTAYVANDDGTLQWYKQAVTDNQGQIIFDLEGLRNGDRYLLKTQKPFGSRGDYYSRLIVSEGPFLFAITEGETGKPDTEFPELAIVSPTPGSTVPAEGFSVIGTASDNESIDRVTASIRSGELEAVTGMAAYNATTGEWTLNVTADQLIPERPTVIRVTAFDGNNNASVQEITFTVDAAIVDNEPPVIELLSHSDGADIPKTGVILQGKVTDDTVLTSFAATVTDPVLGTILSAEPVPFDNDTGHWELVIRNGQMTVDQSITLQLVATDIVANTTTLNAVFEVVPVDHEPMQMLSRLTFGATPQLIAQIKEIGADQFLQNQLNPDNIDDTVFDLFIAGIQPETQADLKFWALQHMLFSEKQLQEVMTQFWDNHFNTDVDAHEVIAYEVNENNSFRQHALGRFRDLLEVSAKSPAMIIYLNNAENIKSAPNENYARELMELHTLGVDGGYDDDDIEQVAKVFTGWHVQNGQFFFNSDEHDFSDKTVLGEHIDGTGLAEGEQVLTMLAAHPNTAAFLCEKLAVLLVSESPSSDTLNTCTTTYLANDGHIGKVVEALVHTPEFGAETSFRNKVKTPLEMLTGVIRNFTANFSQAGMHLAIRRMGMDLFDNAVPTGWSEKSEDWINSNLLLQRTRFVNQVAYNDNANSGNYIDVMALVESAGVTSAEAIVALFFDIALAGDYNETEYQIGLDILNDNGNAFDINAPQAEVLLRRLLGHVMSFPGYQFQ